MKKYILPVIIIFIFFGANAKAAAPMPVNNLSCSFSEEPGSVFLNWTPTVNTASYDVRYFYSLIDESNFNSAYKFNQNWSGSTNRGLVYPLTLDNYWYFAIKGINSVGEISGISNTIKCYISTSTISQESPATTPVSLISNLTNGSTVSVGENYLIFGQSYDVGGSSIQKVEISFDGGITWNLATPKTAIDTGFTFEYSWKPSISGNYTIKTRATDWLNVIEIPGVGVNVTVLPQSQISTSTQPSSNQDTILELRARITQLQQQLIQLLQQLIRILQQQLGTN